jgi:hypothetical protein
MYADYKSGLSLSAIGRKYGVYEVGVIFRARKLPVRAFKIPFGRGPSGAFLRAPEPGKRELEAIIAGMTRIMVPPPLRIVWRHWSDARRKDFVDRVRRRLAGKITSRPESPFSSNVEPFDYFSPRARAFPVKPRLASQGVIWRGELFYWTRQAGYLRSGAWSPRLGRPSLHHLVWSESNGRPVPEKYTVVHLDGNWNNLDPQNLGLRAMTECMRQNSLVRYARIDQRRVRDVASALAKFNQKAA